MTPTPRILLVDDGELGEVAAMLERLDIDHVRLRGGQIGDEVEPPSHLLIATARRASVVKRDVPVDPLRIIAVDEDSNAMRRMLRRMGFHLLVRRGVHAEVWRLLVERALFQGDERREHDRLAVGAPISFASYREARGESEISAALLIDISNRGCRIGTHELLEPGARIALAMRLDDQGGDVLNLRGRVVRCGTRSRRGPYAYTAAMLFDADLADEDRLLLARLLNDLSVGPGSITYGPAEALPPCESPVIPGLTLDAETDPAFHAGVQVDFQSAEEPSRAERADVIDINRRRSPRGNFTSRVVATSGPEDAPHSRVLMGRDLSTGGMRIESLPDVAVGDRFQLAVYGPAEQEPFLIEALVERDDGERGFGLRFLDLSRETARGLEKLVACLPDVESLDEGETGGLGAVVSEIIARTRD